MHAYTHRAFFASKERPETFDVILSISSFEHHEYRRRKYAEINEYRRRKYAENKEAKNISLKDFSLILIIIMPLSFSAGAPPSSWVPPLLQDGFLAGAIWYTTRRQRCQAPALTRARHPGRGGGTGAAGVPPCGTHGPGGVRSP